MSIRDFSHFSRTGAINTSWTGLIFLISFFSFSSQVIALQIARVNAPDIYCLYTNDPTCKLSVDDHVDHFLSSPSGGPYVQSRVSSLGEDGSAAEGLYAYLYRIDLSGISVNTCFRYFSIDIGAITRVDYDGDKKPDDIFIVSSGEIGSVAPVRVNIDNPILLFDFGLTNLCGGKSSFYIGFSSKKPAVNSNGLLIPPPVFSSVLPSQQIDVKVPNFFSDGPPKQVKCESGASLNEELSRAVSGDTFLVSGICKERVVVNNKDNIVIQGKGDGSVLDFSGLAGTGLQFNNAEGVVFRNFTLQNTNRHAIVVDEASNITLDDVKLSRARGGLFIGKDSKVTITDTSPIKIGRLIIIIPPIFGTPINTPPIFDPPFVSAGLSKGVDTFEDGLLAKQVTHANSFGDVSSTKAPLVAHSASDTKPVCTFSAAQITGNGITVDSLGSLNIDNCTVEISNVNTGIDISGPNPGNSCDINDAEVMVTQSSMGIDVGSEAVLQINSSTVTFQGNSGPGINIDSGELVIGGSNNISSMNNHIGLNFGNNFLQKSVVCNLPNSIVVTPNSRGTVVGNGDIDPMCCFIGN